MRGLRWVSEPPDDTQGWPLVAKVSTATGKRAWMTTLDAIPGSNQMAEGLAVDGDGNTVIAGLTWLIDPSDPANVESLGWVYKLGARDGTPVWNRVVVPDLEVETSSSMLWDVAVDGSGRVYCAGGWRSAAASPREEGIVVRYGAGGGSRTIRRWAGDGAGYGNNCFTVICAGGVFVGGSLATTTGETSFVRRLRP